MIKEFHRSRILDVLVGNPLHVYSLVMRLTTQLGPLRLEIAGHSAVAGLEKGISYIFAQGENPDAEDMEGVTQAVARIQFVYRLNPVDLAKGLINGVQTKARLSSVDMINIAMRRNYGMTPIRPGIGREFALAIEWAEGAQTVLEKSKEKNKHLEDTIRSFLNQTRIDHDKYWKAPEENPGNLPNEEYFIRRIGDESNGRDLRKEEAKELYNQVLDREKEGYFVHDFNALCRGDKININKHIDRG